MEHYFTVPKKKNQLNMSDDKVERTILGHNRQNMGIVKYTFLQGIFVLLKQTGHVGSVM